MPDRKKSDDVLAEQSLARIAEALGVPVDSFRRSAGRITNPEYTLELLRLWSELDNDFSCESLLVYARQLVAMQNDSKQN
ncbi:hypothetical protein [Methylobacterium sp. J-068]|uniref:hypothetical protein n=1 Tax=Methylobacterium sp. J-068 TaxID=2836649 RepID=UPI001FBB7408|nr:hypothetical protein [Methylobacterium sp. J-068]MCJ2035417.1 hypothetical protein [Methylobacterium sp. J-068]